MIKKFIEFLRNIFRLEATEVCVVHEDVIDDLDQLEPKLKAEVEESKTVEALPKETVKEVKVTAKPKRKRGRPKKNEKK